MKGLKSRAVRHTEYLIADGFEGYTFVHLDMLFREGRPLEIQQDASRRAMNVLEKTFKHYLENDYISLSVNLREMRDEVALTNHTIPKEGVKRG